MYKAATGPVEDEPMNTTLAILVPVLLLSGCQNAASDDEQRVPTMSVNDLMVTIMTPATDTIWGIENPQTDEDWQVFIDAANVVIEAGETIKVGGTGPNDNDWAGDPAWDVFAERIIAAGADTIKAAESRDVDAMYAAGEALYSPCEECHIQFHPGFQEQ